MSPAHFCTAGTSQARRPGLQDRQLPAAATATAFTRMLLGPEGINDNFSTLEGGGNGDQYFPGLRQVEQKEGIDFRTDRRAY